MKTLAFYNSKGGIGKTTTVFHLSGVFAEREQKVLVIDFDFQGNATHYLTLNSDKPNYSIFDVLLNKCKPEEAVTRVLWQSRANVKPKYHGVDLLSASEGLEGEEWLKGVNMARFHEVMKKFFDENEYDWVLLDMPPQNKAVEKICFHILADYVVTPLSSDTSSASGLGKILRKVEEAKKHNPKIKFLGAFLSNFKFNSAFNQYLLSELKTNRDFINIQIPTSEVIKVHSMECGKPMSFYSKKSRYTDIYRKFADALISRMSK